MDSSRLLEELAPVWNFLVRDEQHNRAVAVGEAERQHLGHELADLARREVDHGRDLAANEALGRIVHGELGRGFLDADLGTEIDLEAKRGLARAVERKWIEELGGMNVFFVFNDGSMSTPPLGGTILPGVTRSSLITLAKDKGIPVSEERYSYDQWKADARSGRLREAFACGTAAVVTPIGTVRAPEGEFVIGNGGSGVRTAELKGALVDIQRCRAPDPHKWIHRVF